MLVCLQAGQSGNAVFVDFYLAATYFVGLWPTVLLLVSAKSASCLCTQLGCRVPLGTVAMDGTAIPKTVA